MINTDYKINALDILLNKDCLLERYYPLIEYKSVLISRLKGLNLKRKSEVEKLTDDDFIKIGIKDLEIVKLLRKFLILYDVKPEKLKEIPNKTDDENERKAFRELYLLAGVKYTRAKLYYSAGYKTLKDFSMSSVDEILQKTTSVIKDENLPFTAPLPKEIRTHIALAKAFTM